MKNKDTNNNKNNMVYLGEHKKGEIEIEKINPVFTNKYITLYDDHVIFPSGHKGNYIRHKWNAPYGVMVIPITKDNKLILVRNFRHQSRLWGWEVVKGFGMEGIKPADCVNIELEEEIGFIAKDIKIVKKFPDSGLTTTLYVARSLEKKKIKHEIGEAISDVKEFTKKECLQLMSQDNCHDPITLLAISMFVNDHL